MSFLNDLFGQILQSEEQIKIRFEQLKDAHSQISNLQSRIKDADFDFQSHHGTIAVKNQKLVKKEMELKWLLTREGILRLQIEEAQAKKNTILTEKVKLQERIISERNKFFEESKEFSKRYELPSNCETEYDKQLKNRIELLKQEIAGAQKELEVINCQLDKTKHLKERIDQINKSILVGLLERDEKQGVLTRSQSKTSLALANKKEIAEQPQKSLEFKRIADALNECQSKSTEMNRQRQELSLELYHSQQQFMKAESQRKTNIMPQKNQAIKKEPNVKGRVSLFKTVYPSNKDC